MVAHLNYTDTVLRNDHCLDHATNQASEFQNVDRRLIKTECRVLRKPRIAQIPLGSSRHISTRLDTFDVSSQSSLSCRAVMFDKLDTAIMHRVET